MAAANSTGVINHVSTPAEFRLEHPDLSAWSATDHDVHRNLAEIAALLPGHDDPPPPDTPAALALLDAEAALARWEADEHLRVEAELELAWADR
jgi:hypothetical protein